jgi:hypothetical protein
MNTTTTMTMSRNPPSLQMRVGGTLFYTLQHQQCCHIMDPPSLQTRVGVALFLYTTTCHVTDPTLASNASRWGCHFTTMRRQWSPTLTKNVSRWGRLVHTTPTTTLHRLPATNTSRLASRMYFQLIYYVLY